MCLFSQVCIILNPLDRPFGANYVEIKKKKKIKLTSCISNYSRKMNIMQSGRKDYATALDENPKTHKPNEKMGTYATTKQANLCCKITGP